MPLLLCRAGNDDMMSLPANFCIIEGRDAVKVIPTQAPTAASSP
jgi:hypothetical protein